MMKLHLSRNFPVQFPAKSKDQLHALAYIKQACDPASMQSMVEAVNPMFHAMHGLCCYIISSILDWLSPNLFFPPHCPLLDTILESWGDSHVVMHQGKLATSANTL